MKDMSVEELEHGMKLVINSDAVDLIGKMAITNTWNELLRRFEELEKEVEKHKRTAICMYCGTVQQTKDGQEKLTMIIEHMAVCEKHPVPKLLGDIENMKNCGNCKSDRRNCIYWNPQGKFNGYCDKWQSDGLSREEREGK